MLPELLHGSSTNSLALPTKPLSYLGNLFETRTQRENTGNGISITFIQSLLYLVCLRVKVLVILENEVYNSFFMSKI